MADVLDRPVIASAEKEATSRGVAVLALEALGLTPDKPATDKIYQPNPQHQAYDQEAVKQQVKFYNKLILDE
ncbi:MAG TPA: carbohydrate kinase, partial [Anaerolineae bacterium]|nr:carbohydrate kinase [Anaerolineae bacterium]